MMIELVLENEMIEQLSSMKGKTLKSYDYYPCPCEGSSLGFIRLNFSNFAIDIETDYKAYTCTGFSGEPYSDEATVITCKKKAAKEKYDIPEGWEMRRYLVGEVVSEIMIVRDTIKISNGDVFVYDNAMVIKTKDSTYTISKGCEVDPSLYIRNNEKIDVPYLVRTERDNFSDTEHKMRATVSRDYIFI